MRVPLAVAALTAVVIACTDSPNHTLAPSFGEIAAPAGGACPGHFVMSKSLKWTLDWKVQGRDPADDNGDFLICELRVKEPEYTEKGGTLLKQGVVVLIDNNIPPEKFGKCPLTFAAAAVFQAEEDANGNSVVCKGQAEDVGLVVVDDNDS